MDIENGLNRPSISTRFRKAFKLLPAQFSSKPGLNNQDAIWLMQPSANFVR